MQQRPDPGILPGEMPLGGPFDMALVTGLMTRNGHSAWCGARFHGESAEWVELAQPWNEHLVADAESGIMASGPIISMMDNACGIALWRARGVFLPQVTLDLRVDYMRPARKGRTVIGRAECYRLTRSVGFVRGIAYDERPDDPVAHVAGTFMLLDAAQ